MIGLTKSLGKELAKSRVTVNAVTPAAVRTPIFDQITQEHIEFMLSKIPMGGFGTVDEIAALVCWLASEECSFSTGAVFDTSGGRAVYSSSERLWRNSDSERRGSSHTREAAALAWHEP